MLSLIPFWILVLIGAVFLGLTAPVSLWLAHRRPSSFGGRNPRLRLPLLVYGESTALLFALIAISLSDWFPALRSLIETMIIVAGVLCLLTFLLFFFLLRFTTDGQSTSHVRDRTHNTDD